MKLRISNHKLNIETGRYDRISRCDRICPVYGLNIEDEIHLLCNCPKYQQLETTFLIKLKIESLLQAHANFNFDYPTNMNSIDYDLNSQLVRYVSSCLEIRDNLLSKV